MKCSPVQMKGTKFSLKLCLVCYTTRNGSFYSISSPKVNVLKLSGLFESHYVHYLSLACLLRVWRSEEEGVGVRAPHQRKCKLIKLT